MSIQKAVAGVLRRDDCSSSQKVFSQYDVKGCGSEKYYRTNQVLRMPFPPICENASNYLPLNCGYGIPRKPLAAEFVLLRLSTHTQASNCLIRSLEWDNIPKTKLRKSSSNAFGSLTCAEKGKHAGKENPRVQIEDVSVTSIKDRLLKRLSNTLTERQLLKPQEKVLVAVSGGQDSVSLIWLLHMLNSSWGWRLGIAHCDHQWHSASHRQASHVSQIATDLKLDFYQAVATRPVSGESAARTWRYEVLQRIAICHGYTTLLTAHTLSDRVETLLYNMFRGSGIHGLQSLTWKRSLSTPLVLANNTDFSPKGTVKNLEHPKGGLTAARKHEVALIRPLLDTTRKELSIFCQQLQLPVWLDPSNDSLEFKRNRIRIELIPYIRQHFQPEVEKSLARLADIVQEEDAYLNNLCETILIKAETGSDNKLDVNVILSLPLALQRRVLKLFVERFTGRSLGFDHIERIRLMCYRRTQKQSKIDVPGSSCLIFTGSHIQLSKNQCSD